MKQQLRIYTQISATFLLAGILLLFSGCILEVLQPTLVDAGKPFEVLIRIDPQATGTYTLYLGIRLPSDWQVLDTPRYTEGLTGAFTYDPTAIPSLETQFGVLTDTIWWAGFGPSIPVTNGLTVTIQARVQSSITARGVYTLFYADGIYTDTLVWRDSDYLHEHPITVTVLSEFLYLPLAIQGTQ